MRQAGATPHRGARASHRRGLSRCGAQAPDAQAQQPRLTGPAAPRHAGSPQTRARTRAPCTGRQTPNHCATREAPLTFKIHCLVTFLVSVLSSLLLSSGFGKFLFKYYNFIFAVSRYIRERVIIIDLTRLQHYKGSNTLLPVRPVRRDSDNEISKGKVNIKDKNWSLQI